MLEIIKIFTQLSIWFILFPFKLSIAILNLISCKQPKICEEITFLKPHSSGQSIPIQYTVLSSDKLGLGHLIVCFIRRNIKTKKVFQIDDIYDKNGFRKDHKIIKESLEKVILIKDLDSARADSQFLR